jgi:hypothetical protein
MPSTAEIPDAIGWNTHGSVVVECKTSRADFMRDRDKRVLWRRPGETWAGKYSLPKGRLEAAGYERVVVPRRADDGARAVKRRKCEVCGHEWKTRYAPDWILPCPKCKISGYHEPKAETQEGKA